MFYSLKEARAHFRQGQFAHLVSIWAVGISLLLVGLFLLVLANLNRGLARISEKVGVIAFLKDNLSEKQINSVQENLHKIGNVKAIEFTSKQQALNELLTSDPDLAKQIELVGKNPLPASFNIKIVDKTPAQVANLVSQIKKLPEIEEVKYSKEEVENITRLVRSLKLFGLGFVGFLGVVALVIIIYTIKLTVSLQSEDIKVMKLLGASKWFVRLPFLWGGIEEGFFGALLAMVLLYIGYRLLGLKFNQIVFLPYNYILSFIGAGVILGFLGSLISIEAYLRD